ncbi:hypothetical protein [Brackiella oedipodis]|uniref:hypothetical protein n=1 Tax=Brackiella oedipodis TaxID=124225 RepID=UPI0004900DC8|nr:hypothetical protein [Brackiella oedipodis]
MQRLSFWRIWISFILGGLISGLLLGLSVGIEYVFDVQHEVAGLGFVTKPLVFGVAIAILFATVYGIPSLLSAIFYSAMYHKAYQTLLTVILSVVLCFLMSRFFILPQAQMAIEQLPVQQQITFPEGLVALMALTGLVIVLIALFFIKRAEKKHVSSLRS